jgi:D-3-phosphoglycerate dehydrogenase / 2-oxoglutarate reductase
MKSVYIDCSPFARSVLTPDMLKAHPDLITYDGDPDPATLDALMQDATAIINGHTYMDAAFLARYPALRSIVFLGTGASSYIDVEAASRQGIAIRTVRGYGDRTIAEHGFALMLAAARQIGKMDRDLRGGVWETPVGVELAGKRLGIIGTGGTGRELIRIADAFGMEVVAWNRTASTEALPCTFVSLETLLSTSDVVSIHLALNEATRGFLNSERLAMLKPDALLVNVGRGALIDEAALVETLEQRRIAHAALDVFEQEPLPADHPLTRLDNVTLTSHGAYKTREAMIRLVSGGLALLREELDALADNTTA